MSISIISIVFTVVMFSLILAESGSSNNSDDGDDNRTISSLNNSDDNDNRSSSVCIVNNKTYSLGESFKASDGCNECKCSGNDTISCTEKGCVNNTRIRERLQNKSHEDCGDKDSRKDRIKCRLGERKFENYFKNESVAPEFCRNETYREKCVDHFKKLHPCYNKEGKEKLACFRRVAGLTNAALNGQDVKKDEMRLYVVSLLNDLQLRVEQLNTEGKINNVTAVNMIDKITQINEKILSGANASEVRPLIQDLKKLWKAARVTKLEEADDDEDKDTNETEIEDDDGNSNINVTDDDEDEEDDDNNLNNTGLNVTDDSDNNLTLNNTGVNNGSQ